MHQDENTGLWVNANGSIAPVDRPPLAQLREAQLSAYGHWTADRNTGES